MSAHATPDQIEDVVARLDEAGCAAYVTEGKDATVIGAIGERELLAALPLEGFPGVEQVLPILKPYKLVSREISPDPSVIDVRGRRIGHGWFGFIAGPCTVETRAQTLETARVVAAEGVTMLRGGAFKPRTSPYAFQGLEEEGLRLLRDARKATGLPVVTEVMEPDKVDVVAEHADILQIGARNVQNFSLLKRVAECGKPVLLKRGMSTSIQEWLLSAEYVLAGGNPNVILCERGIRTFETSTRYTLDLNAIPVVKKLSHLPVVVDPSHGTGHWEYVAAMAKAGLAAGADGLIIEVHNNPAEALSDGPQSLKPDKFAKLMAELKPLAQVLGRSL